MAVLSLKFRSIPDALLNAARVAATPGKYFSLVTSLRLDCWCLALTASLGESTLYCLHQKRLFHSHPLPKQLTRLSHTHSFTQYRARTQTRHVKAIKAHAKVFLELPFCPSCDLLYWSVYRTDVNV